MTECTVTCRDCSEPPKTWRWLCVECAEEQLGRHRADTGHNPVLHVAAEVTLDDIRRDMTAARRVMLRKAGPWPGW